VVKHLIVCLPGASGANTSDGGSQCRREGVDLRLDLQDEVRNRLIDALRDAQPLGEAVRSQQLPGRRFLADRPAVTLARHGRIRGGRRQCLGQRRLGGRQLPRNTTDACGLHGPPGHALEPLPRRDRRTEDPLGLRQEPGKSLQVPAKRRDALVERSVVAVKVPGHVRLVRVVERPLIDLAQFLDPEPLVLQQLPARIQIGADLWVGELWQGVQLTRDRTVQLRKVGTRAALDLW
jgi:hypothetical protein